jgi:uncharacterized protein
MKLSQYIKTYPSDEMPGHLVVYSTKRASLLLIKEEIYQAIEKGILSSEDEGILLKTGIVVPDIEEEKKDVACMLDRLNAKNSVLNLSVIINLDCNFSCVYCYEGEMKGKIYMTEETANRLIEFIRERFTEDKKQINLDFYGGEPLLSKGLIEYISRSLKAFAESRGASYTFTLVTNGSLLRRSVAEELARLGLTNVKITIDGPAEIHNKYRPFRSGAGSFDAIIRNIRETWDVVKVAVSGNYDRDTYRRFVPLLDYMNEAGLTPERIYLVKFAPVVKRPQGDTSPADYNEGCISVNEPWLLEADALLREEILKRDYRTTKMAPSPCQVGVTDYYVVNYDGALSKCPALIGKKDFEIGDVVHGIKDYRDSYKLDIWKNEKCLDCEYIPLCFGGCRYMAYVRDGNIDTIDCKKPYLDAALETMIRQDVKYRHPSKKA